MSVRAWLLTPAFAPRLAIAEHALIEVISDPVTIPIAATRPERQRVIRWQEQLIALTEPNRIGSGAAADQNTPASATNYAVIGAWQAAPGERLNYGAIALDQPPRAISVDDEMETPLPDGLDETWSSITTACFDPDGNGPVIAIDVRGLLSQ